MQALITFSYSSLSTQCHRSYGANGNMLMHAKIKQQRVIKKSNSSPGAAGVVQSAAADITVESKSINLCTIDATSCSGSQEVGTCFWVSGWDRTDKQLITRPPLNQAKAHPRLP